MYPEYAASAVDAVIAWQRMGIHLISAGGQIITFIFPVFTLNPFFSMASFHDTFLQQW